MAKIEKITDLGNTSLVKINKKYIIITMILNYAYTFQTLDSRAGIGMGDILYPPPPVCYG